MPCCADCFALDERCDEVAEQGAAVGGIAAKVAVFKSGHDGEGGRELLGVSNQRLLKPASRRRGKRM